MTAPATDLRPGPSDTEAPLSARAEWVIAGVLAALAVALTTYLARDLWFTSDEWEFLANRTAFDLGDLTRPIGGHWATWSVLLLRGIYDQVGVDFWPWFFIPRLIGHTLLAIYIWRIVRRRGAPTDVGLVGLAVLLVLAVSGYQRALQVGNWVVYAALLYAATVVARDGKPSGRDRILVGGALLLAVLGNGYSIAAIAGIGIALLFARRLVPWIPSLVPAVGIYGIWALRYGDTLKEGPHLPARLIGLPADAFRVLRTAVEETTARPGLLAAAVVLGLLAWVGVLALRRRLDLFDGIILTTLAVGLFLLAFQRVAIEPEAAYRLRYGYSIVILGATALLPHVRRPGNWWGHGLVAVIGAWLLIANIAGLASAIDVRVQVSQDARRLAVTATTMIAAGEPIVDSPSRLAPGLNTQELSQLIADGYQPDALPADTPESDEIEATARGVLRVGVVDQRRLRGGPQGAPVLVAEDQGRVEDGCLVIAEEQDVAVTITDGGTLRFVKRPPQALELEWADEFGVGRRLVDDPDPTRIALQLAQPTDRATLRFTSPRGDLRVCGFAP